MTAQNPRGSQLGKCKVWLAESQSQHHKAESRSGFGAKRQQLNMCTLTLPGMGKKRKTVLDLLEYVLKHRSREMETTENYHRVQFLPCCPFLHLRVLYLLSLCLKHLVSDFHLFSSVLSSNAQLRQHFLKAASPLSPNPIGPSPTLQPTSSASPPCVIMSVFPHLTVRPMFAPFWHTPGHIQTRVSGHIVVDA